ncbi:unnamed protein product [Cylicostephanus goldi]|uniref:Uncharacterized protein n=1 Tax=Cylicostephanus goldi TaxID=71465 RepID=A0A3P6TDH7_CYLGO|nr:unnamed protein product [Cylicostephanus goldi]
MLLRGERRRFSPASRKEECGVQTNDSLETTKKCFKHHSRPLNVKTRRAHHQLNQFHDKDPHCCEMKHSQPMNKSAYKHARTSAKKLPSTTTSYGAHYLQTAPNSPDAKVPTRALLNAMVELLTMTGAEGLTVRSKRQRPRGSS